MVGALINSSSLIALCIQLFIEALNRFVEISPPDEDSCPDLKGNSSVLIIVSLIGLLVNILGLVIFTASCNCLGRDPHAAQDACETRRGDHHHGDGHDHSHDHGHSHGQALKCRSSLDTEHAHSHGHGHGHSHDHGHSHGAKPRAAAHPAHDSIKPNNDLAPETECGPKRQQEKNKKKGHGHSHSHGHGGGHSHGDMNVQAVLMHVAGDALGSIGALLAGLIIRFVDSDWACYADPATSLFITGIILYGTVPLLFASSKRLLDKVHVSCTLVCAWCMFCLHGWGRLRGPISYPSMPFLSDCACCFHPVCQPCRAAWIGSVARLRRGRNGCLSPLTRTLVLVRDAT